MVCVRLFCTLLVILLAVPAMPAYAQQTGAIIGKIADTGGGVLPGVTVEASADVLPSPRVTVSGANGEYRFPALPPGNYTIKFELSGMQSATRQARVQLGQDTAVNAELGVAGVAETINVTAAAAARTTCISSTAST